MIITLFICGTTTLGVCKNRGEGGARESGSAVNEVQMYLTNDTQFHVLVHLEVIQLLFGQRDPE